MKVRDFPAIYEFAKQGNATAQNIVIGVRIQKIQRSYKFSYSRHLLAKAMRAAYVALRAIGETGGTQPA